MSITMILIIILVALGTIGLIYFIFSGIRSAADRASEKKRYKEIEAEMERSKATEEKSDDPYLARKES